MINRERLPNRRRQTVMEIDHAGHHYTVGVGFYQDGRPGEVFLNSGKAGTAVETNARDGAILLSLLLQLGVSLSTLQHMVTRDQRGAALGPLGAVLDLLISEQG